MSRSVLAIWLLIPLTIISLAVIAHTMHRQFEKNSITQNQKQLLTLAKSLGKNLKGFIASINSEMNGLTLNPIIAKSIQEKKAEVPFLQSWYLSSKEVFREFGASVSAVYLLNEKGYVQVRVPFKPSWKGENYADKPSVQFAIAHKKNCMRRVKTSSGYLSIAISYPVFDQGTFVGVVRALVYLESLGNIVNFVNLEKEVYTQIINCADGSIINHSNEKYMGKNIQEVTFKDTPLQEQGSFQEIWRKISQGEQGIGLYKVTKTKGLILTPSEDIIAFSPVEFGEELWSINITMDYDEIAEPIKRHEFNLSILVLMVILILGLGLHAFYREQRKNIKLAQEAKYFAQLAKSAEEIRRKDAELLHAARLASLGEMMAGITHEINQPLTGIMNYAETALDFLELRPDDHDSIQKNIEKVIEQVRRAKKISQHLKAFARRGEGEHSELNLNPIIKKTVQFLDIQLKRYDMEVVFNFGENIPLVKGNQIQIEQVFTNLICNAIDASTSKKSKQIYVQTKVSSNNEVLIEIEDQGSGFDSDTANRLFDPFFTTKEVGKGTGLGLSISFRIVKEHGGQISAESELGKGTRFTITLPRLEKESKNE